jgi:hypothetical protein
MFKQLHIVSYENNIETYLMLIYIFFKQKDGNIFIIEIFYSSYFKL